MSLVGTSGLGAECHRRTEKVLKDRTHCYFYLFSWDVDVNKNIEYCQAYHLSSMMNYY